MLNLNTFQKEFMQAVAAIQEESVQITLCQSRNSKSLENTLYDVTNEAIVRLMELFDGYTNTDIGQLVVICKKSGESLKDDPYIELHDVVCGFLKSTKE